ncbi:MAG TPA: hypothetical protein VGB64_02345 [Actinomycetota bacterium]
MRRFVAVAFLVAALPVGAQAGVARCDGIAPLEPGCTFTVVATTAHVDAMLVSDLFTGVAEYAVAGPTGSISASCYAYPGVTTCFPSHRGWFAPGDSITVTVGVTGAGSWAFSLRF